MHFWIVNFNFNYDDNIFSNGEQAPCQPVLADPVQTQTNELYYKFCTETRYHPIRRSSKHSTMIRRTSTDAHGVTYRSRSINEITSSSHIPSMCCDAVQTWHKTTLDWFWSCWVKSGQVRAGESRPSFQVRIHHVKSDQIRSSRSCQFGLLQIASCQIRSGLVWSGLFNLSKLDQGGQALLFVPSTFLPTFLHHFSLSLSSSSFPLNDHGCHCWDDIHSRKK